MHDCFTVLDWIRAWTVIDREETGLSRRHRPEETGCGASARVPAAELVASAGPRLAAELAVGDDVLDCPRCLAACDQLDGQLEALEHFDPAVAAESYDTEELFRELAVLSDGEQRARIGADRRCHRWSLCQRFLAESEEHWRREPALAHRRAATAVAIADALDEETYHPRWVADLRAKARAYLGNTLRILARFGEAEVELRKAEVLARRGVESGRIEARILSLQASLLIDLGRRAEAEHLLARVEEFYQTTGQSTELARTQLKRADLLAYREEYRAAAEECARAYGNLDPRAEPRLALIACQNAANHLVHAGEVERARSLLEGLPPTDERIVLLRRKWIEANLLRAERRFSQAMEAYEEVRAGYVAEGIGHVVAVISLDQALAAYEMGDYAAMAVLAREAQALVEATPARQEATAALRLLRTAIAEGTVTRSIVSGIRKHVADIHPAR